MTWSQNQVSKGKTKTIENHTKGKGLGPNEGPGKCRTWQMKDLAEFQNRYRPVICMFISWCLFPNGIIQT